MNRTEEPERDIHEPGDRLARMTRASIRITETLDLDTVLRGVAEGACFLTGARRGGITVLDDGGQLQSFITSGLTPEEEEALVGLPGGLELFEHLSGLSEPMRISDFSDYSRELGLPQVNPALGLVRAFLAGPIRHLGRLVGNFYLSDKEGDAEFTPEDEVMLALFASQAALAIANARRYRDEQRARADLETLVNTAPVGVVVFDARTGALALSNREVQRIFDGLREPGQTPEQFLEVLTFRRADGREISLAEFPMAQALSAGETVRAEEITIQVPDGRRVNIIVNATPIISEAGEVESMVVTVQDLAPTKKLDRQRAEFLGLVSQELLAPLTSIKGSAAAVLDDLARLDPTKAGQFFRIIEWQADRMRGLIWDLLDVASIEAGTLFLAPEPTDLASLAAQARAAFVEGRSANPVEMDLPPDLPRVAADRQRTLQVLNRLLSNAASYSSEGAAIVVSARREDQHVAVCVADRGRGIPSQPLPLLFDRLSRREPGDGGSGVDTGGWSLGLAVCRGIVEAHGGRIWAENDGPGLGSRFLFTLPVAEEATPSGAGSTGPSAPRNRRSVRGQGRVLVVDDDPQTLWHIRNVLTEANYSPVVTWEPDEVERLIMSERPHLVLLGGGELGLMQRVLNVTDVPVVLLSGPGGDRNLALAFETGADDYIGKPFSPTELVARVGAALRRREAPRRAASRESFQLGELAIDYVRRRVELGGRALTLTDTEYRLLCELAMNAGQPLSRGLLMNRVWAARETTDSRVVRAYVKRLRQKLGESAGNPTYIFNEPRVGYRLGPARDEEDAAPSPA